MKNREASCEAGVSREGGLWEMPLSGDALPGAKSDSRVDARVDNDPDSTVQGAASGVSRGPAGPGTPTRSVCLHDPSTQHLGFLFFPLRIAEQSRNSQEELS